MLKANAQFYKRKENSVELSESWKPEDFLDKVKVVEILGRRAFTARNNLRYDCNGKIVYSAGHTLVLFDGKNNLKDFLYLEDESNITVHEISNFAMSSDQRFAYACHNGSVATIVVWEINSKIPVKKVVLNKVCSILLMALSDSNKKALILALDEKRSISIMLSLIHI